MHSEKMRQNVANLAVEFKPMHKLCELNMTREKLQKQMGCFFMKFLITQILFWNRCLKSFGWTDLDRNVSEKVTFRAGELSWGFIYTKHQSQSCDNASDTAVIDYNGVAPE